MGNVGEVQSDLMTLAKKGVLSHGYVLYGESLKRQFEVAQSLANFLEHGNFSLPEKVLLDALFFDGTTEKLGIEVSRSVLGFLYRAPIASPRRTLVISGAQELTTEAQSALLKVLEEPPASSLIILVVRDLGVLLLPLLSRLQKIYISGGRVAGEMDEERYGVVKKLVGQFLGSANQNRKDLIKTLVADSPELVDSFLVVLMEELKKKPIVYKDALAEILKRYTAMNQFTVNKRLQLETIIDFL